MNKDAIKAKSRQAMMDEKIKIADEKSAKTSIYTGVSKAQSGSRYKCQISQDNENIPIGTFDTQADAAYAYDTKVSVILIIYHGIR